MVIALVWFGVLALVALWSFSAWALYALTAWALANAGALTGVPGLVDALNLPQWIAPWLPPELAATLPAMVASLKPVIDLVVGWAPAIAGSLSTLAWVAWALGSAVILALGLLASVLVVRYRGRSLRMPSVGGFMPLKTNR